MNFKLSDGPWKQLFKGLFEEYEVEIYINPESLVLVSILEKEAGKIKGAVIELYKVFHAVGDLHGFIETLPREVIAVTKHDEKETTQFFILGSKPNYVEYSEEKFQDEVDSMTKRIKVSTKMLLDVSKAYDLQLRELHECDERTKQAFFSQPLMVPFLSTAAHPPAAAIPAAVPATGKAVSFGELILGITKDGTAVKEPLALFGSTIVSGGSEKERRHALHLLIEGALLSNLAAVVVDWSAMFEGLSNRTSNVAELKKYKVEIEPIGFPVKDFHIPQQIKVDLNLVNKKGLMEILGLGESIAAKEIQKIIEETEVKSLLDVVKVAKERKLGGDFNEFQRNRVVRVLKLMDLRYPELFDGENDIKEISKGWLKGLGMAGLIRLEGHDERVSLMVVSCLLKGILEYYKKQGPSKQLRSLFVLPEAKRVVPRNEDNELIKALVKDLNEMKQYGVGFVLGCKNEIDLAEGILKESEAKISIVKGNDAGIQLKGRKNYRVLLRPGLSECTDLQ